MAIWGGLATFTSQPEAEAQAETAIAAAQPVAASGWAVEQGQLAIAKDMINKKYSALLLSPISLLPFQVGAVVYAVLMLAVGVVTVRVLFGWLCPTLAVIGVPLALLWLNIWYPGRGALENGGTIVCALGLVLVLRGVADGRGVRVGAAALGIALALVKPPFGIPVLVVALAGGRWDAVWRGAVGIAVASLPAGIAAVVAAGGPAGFAAAIARDVAYASSPSAPTSLLAPHPSRIDLLGELARLGLVATSTWQLIVPLLMLVALAFVGRLRTDPLTFTALVTAAVLLGTVHLPYDLVIMVVPAVAGLGLLLHGPLDRWRLLTWIAVLVPVVHVHALTRVLPLPDPFPDIVDSAALVLAAAFALVRERASR